MQARQDRVRLGEVIGVSDLKYIRGQLVRVGLAHSGRADLAVAALPSDREPTPPWLDDAWRGSSMAALYAHTLAALLEDLEQRLAPDEQENLGGMVEFWLENGVEDANLDVWPTEATP